MGTNTVPCTGDDCYICQVLSEETGQFVPLDTQTVDNGVDNPR